MRVVVVMVCVCGGGECCVCVGESVLCVGGRVLCVGRESFVRVGGVGG